MTGWFAPGLMIFLPLSDDIMLWLFDPLMYKPHANITTDSTLSIKKDQDVDELNRLQILNANEHVIFSKPDYNNHVASLHAQVRHHRRSELVRTEKMAEFDVSDERHEIYRFGKTEVFYNPHLSFLRTNKTYVEDRKRAYKAHVAKFGLGGLFVRNERLYAFHVIETANLMKEMRAKKNEPISSGVKDCYRYSPIPPSFFRTRFHLDYKICLPPST